MHPNRLIGLRTPHNQADETAIRNHRAATHESRVQKQYRESNLQSPLENYISFDMITTIKPLAWLRDSLDRVREFSPAARQLTGFELWEVQQGKDPTSWKPMPTVGLGVREIRAHADGAYRVLYVAKFVGGCLRAARLW